MRRTHSNTAKRRYTMSALICTVLSWVCKYDFSIIFSILYDFSFIYFSLGFVLVLLQDGLSTIFFIFSYLDFLYSYNLFMIHTDSYCTFLSFAPHFSLRASFYLKRAHSVLPFCGITMSPSRLVFLRDSLIFTTSLFVL